MRELRLAVYVQMVGIGEKVQALDQVGSLRQVEIARVSHALEVPARVTSEALIARLEAS